MEFTRTDTSRLWVFGVALVGFGALAGCISDDGEPEAETGGTGGTTGGSGGTTGGSGGTTGGSSPSGGSSGTSPSGAVCAAPIAIPSDNPGFTDFESYDGTDLADWSFPLGGDSAIGVFAGTFGYGDEPSGSPETFEMVAGNDSTYALGISDTLAEEYGGGMGLWISECLDLTAFSGISFWVRGNSPTGDAELSLLMEETTSTMASGTSKGTCTGNEETCVHPTFVFPVTDDWTEVEVAWSEVTAGDAAGTPVVPDGSNIWQIQFDVGLVWVDDGTGVYQPTPAEYELAVDDVAFY